MNFEEWKEQAYASIEETQAEDSGLNHSPQRERAREV